MQKRSSGSVRIFYPGFDREEIIRIITEKLEALDAKLPLVLVVLFGSYARGNYTVGSDVDVLLVYRGESRPDAYAIVRKTVNVPRLQPHVYTEEEHQEMKQTLGKMTKGGVVLFALPGAAREEESKY